MPVCYPKYAGRPYRPSNGTEGMLFEERFCDHCTQGVAHTCDIYARAFVFDLGDEDYPTEWIYDAEGCPTCTAFVDIRDQGDLFDAKDRTVDG